MNRGFDARSVSLLAGPSGPVSQIASQSLSVQVSQSMGTSIGQLVLSIWLAGRRMNLNSIDQFFDAMRTTSNIVPT